MRLTLQKCVVERTKYGYISGYPEIDWSIDRALGARQVFMTGTEPIIIRPEPKTIDTSLYTYENVPPEWVFAGLFEGSPVGDGNRSVGWAIWFGDSILPNLDAILPIIQEKWAMFSRDVYW